MKVACIVVAVWLGAAGCGRISFDEPGGGGDGDDGGSDNPGSDAVGQVTVGCTSPGAAIQFTSNATACAPWGSSTARGARERRSLPVARGARRHGQTAVAVHSW